NYATPSNHWLLHFELESASVFHYDKSSLLIRHGKVLTPFGLSLSKSGIGAGLAVRQAHRER
ncbi:hypothetical protein, partial [Candidatus Nitrotoga sp. 1052]|uniref:hypothetical protein n=1 Tax=Candidatus Nitrotoga sp. 1052 TaxID=2886964 RepID=UPI001EF72487